MASEAEGSERLRAAGVPPLRRSDDLDSPGDGQMKSCTYHATLAGLTKITAFRTKEGLQWAARFTAINPELLGGRLMGFLDVFKWRDVAPVSCIDVASDLTWR